jgi:hypothetical protein
MRMLCFDRRGFGVTIDLQRQDASPSSVAVSTYKTQRFGIDLPSRMAACDGQPIDS